MNGPEMAQFAGILTDVFDEDAIDEVLLRLDRSGLSKYVGRESGFSARIRRLIGVANREGLVGRASSRNC